MARLRGKYYPLSLPRRLVGDLVHFAHQVPTVPVQRWMNLLPLLQERRQCPRHVSWCTLFTKGYACVAQRLPLLRRAYLAFPVPRLYEHPANVAAVAVGRQYQDEEAVFFVHLNRPEAHSLFELEDRLRHYKEAPLESLSLIRRALWLSRWPRPLRRAVWWFGLNVSGPNRARRLGTFGVSVYSGLGAESLHPLSPLTTALNYGTIQSDGSVPVRLVYDHRVLDGATVARALVMLEQVLNGEIADELSGKPAAQAA